MLTKACDAFTRGAYMARSDRGLYHGKSKQYGNKISFSHRATRRSWTPNVQNKKFTSHLLNVTLQIPITTKTLRCIDKAGSLDEYLLRTHPEDLASENGNKMVKLLIPKWEEQNGRPFDRRQYVYELRLTERQKKGRVSQSEAIELINKSRLTLASRRKWEKDVPLLTLPEEEAAASAPTPAAPAPTEASSSPTEAVESVAAAAPL